ncbi:MAG: alpha/beta hydrolase [Pseudomonadales bacterium]
MAKKHNYDIDSDFDGFPVITLGFSAFIIWCLNTFMRIEAWRVRRKLKGISLHKLTSADGAQFKVWQIDPDNASDSAPALLYYHGGAFALTYGSPHLLFCQRYANETGARVFFVDYRLMPRNPFPAGFDDCYATLTWVQANSKTLGVNADKIAVGGDSAGGALAAGVAQKHQDLGGQALCGQLLIYPVIDNSCSTESATVFTDTPLFNAISNRAMWQAYLPSGEVPAYAAPISYGSLTGQPAAYVETAEFDPLRDEGIAYAERLAQDGVKVELRKTLRTMHGYDTVTHNPISQESMEKRIAFLRTVFA